MKEAIVWTVFLMAENRFGAEGHLEKMAVYHHTVSHLLQHLHNNGDNFVVELKKLYREVV